MRIARFYQKTLFGVFTIIGLILTLTSALYVNTVDRQLTGDFLNNSRANCVWHLDDGAQSMGLRYTCMLCAELLRWRLRDHAAHDD
jgi:hypothetical protein